MSLLTLVNILINLIKECCLMKSTQSNICIFWPCLPGLKIYRREGRRVICCTIFYRILFFNNLIVRNIHFFIQSSSFTKGDFLKHFQIFSLLSLPLVKESKQKKCIFIILQQLCSARIFHFFSPSAFIYASVAFVTHLSRLTVSHWTVPPLI